MSIFPNRFKTLWDYFSVTLDYENRKHNEPISTIFKRYLDKDGGMVSNSRREIQRRFYALDWKYQKQILFAFLKSGKYDREWAYTQLYAVWDDCFIPVLKGLWEQYHEKRLSWLIIKVFPIDYLKKEFESLSEGRNYFFLFLRLRNESDFVLDRTRLNEADLLAVKYKLGEKITDGDVRDLFFLLIYKLCKGTYQFKVRKTIENRTYLDQPLLAIFTFPTVGSILAVIRELWYKPYLFEEIQKWMLQVTDGFSKTYENLDDCNGLDKESYLREKIKDYCLKQIPSEYVRVWDSIDLTNQQTIMDALEQRHNEHVIKEDVANTEIISTYTYIEGDNPFGNSPFKIIEET